MLKILSCARLMTSTQLCCDDPSLVPQEVSETRTKKETESVKVDNIGKPGKEANVMEAESGGRSFKATFLRLETVVVISWCHHGSSISRMQSSNTHESSK